MRPPVPMHEITDRVETLILLLETIVHLSDCNTGLRRSLIKDHIGSCAVMLNSLDDDVDARGIVGEVECPTCGAADHPQPCTLANSKAAADKLLKELVVDWEPKVGSRAEPMEPKP